MFSKTLILCMLFGLTNGAKDKVTSSNKNGHVTKDEKLNAIKTKYKNYRTSLMSMAKIKSSSNHDKIKKRLKNAQKLQEWNNYDPQFNTKFYWNMMFWSGSNCDDDGLLMQMTEVSSYCYVYSIVTSESQNYESAQKLFNSEGTLSTLVFYTSNDCSGTPVQQSNTVSEYSGSKDECYAYTNDDNYILSSTESTKMFYEDSVAPWQGGGAVKFTDYGQTTSCPGTPENFMWIRAGCYKMDEFNSIEFKEGPYVTIHEGLVCDDPIGDLHDPSVSCLGDDDDGNGYYYGSDDTDGSDDNFIDDEMFTHIDGSDSTATSVSWVGDTGDTDCQKGMYKMNGICNVCPAGSYSNGMSSTCTLCQPGKYATYFASECLDCPSGTYAVGRGSSKCHVCPVNTYPNDMNSRCLSCPKGKMASPGSTQCKSCSA